MHKEQYMHNEAFLGPDNETNQCLSFCGTYRMVVSKEAVGSP